MCETLAIVSVVLIVCVGTVSAKADIPQPNLIKDSGVCDCVNSGGDITYTICYDNPASFEIQGVVLIDTLPPETKFESVSAGGVHNETYHNVTWNIGALKAGAKACVTVNVTVKQTTYSSEINNTATLNYIYDNLKFNKTTFNETEICETQIPEFTTIALPVVSILGLFFFFNYRRRR
jgi:uncharacterized repeat protein (TIGR01451 family)